jgi:signal transduction histidine kinase
VVCSLDTSVGRTAREAGNARAHAVADAAKLAQEIERARHARMLHDRVLQTLETLARNQWLADPDLRDHIQGEPAWLRSLVEGTPFHQPGDLLTALDTLLQRKTLTGLRIDFNGTQLRDAVQLRRGLSPQVVEALVDATGEALTNVAKHSGAESAIVAVTVTRRHLTISVLDHGCRFDQTTARHGIGLEHSVSARLADVGGTARIDSTDRRRVAQVLCHRWPAAVSAARPRPGPAASHQ